MFFLGIYRKKIFSCVYTNLISILSKTYKSDLIIKSQLFQCFSLCSDFTKFHYEIDILVVSIDIIVASTVPKKAW